MSLLQKTTEEEFKQMSNQERYECILRLQGSYNRVCEENKDIVLEKQEIIARYLALKQESDRYERYLQYLQTDEWKTKADIVKKKAGNRCQLCNDDEKLQVHHRTYERLYNEDLDDLTCLCDRCHKRFHRIKRSK